MKLLMTAGGSVLQLASENPDDAQFLKKLVTDYMSPKEEPRIAPLAEVSIELLPNGFLRMSMQRDGRYAGSYAKLPQDRVLTIELPKLIAELREPIKQLPAHMTA